MLSSQPSDFLTPGNRVGLDFDSVIKYEFLKKYTYFLNSEFFVRNFLLFRSAIPGGQHAHDNGGQADWIIE